MSVLLLLFMTFTNFALEIVNAQMHQLDSPNWYDALSPDVISPPFRYKSSHSGNQPPRLGLGSAAIATVTDALSPILPFTGGVDLRSEELWDKGSWYHSATCVMQQVRDAFGLQPVSVLDIPRGGAQSNGKLAIDKSLKQIKTDHASPISDVKPFVSINAIADLTLSDLTVFIEYAVGNNRIGFDRARFVNSANDRVKPLLKAMDATVQTSRGKDVLPALTQQESTTGDVDALQFCAALRIFAEWRMVRQVPEGYKGYAMGMNLGHKDVLKNLGKMENAAHEWLDHQRQVLALQQAWRESSGDTSEEEEVLRSPTLRDLLEHEIEMDVHNRLPRLKEKTAAMGLLWVRRQLHYQTSVFANILKVPSEFPDAHAAVSHAYKEVYGQYHGWAVQKIFNYSFQAAPNVEEIYKFMNPHELAKAQDAARRMASSSYQEEQMDEATAGEDEDGQEQRAPPKAMNPFERFGNHIGSEWDKLARHVGGEWDKLVDSVVRVFDQDSSSSKGTRVRGGGQFKGIEGSELDQFITERMAKDAHAHIEIYLTSVEPLLQDLAGLFDDLNMDDPTKV